MNVNKMTDKEYIDYLFDEIDTLETELQNEHECKMNAIKYAVHLGGELAAEKAKRVDLERRLKEMTDRCEYFERICTASHYEEELSQPWE